MCDATLFWFTVTAVIQAFLDSNMRDGIGLFYAVIGIPLTALVYIMIMNHRNSIYMRMTVKNFKKDNDVEMYINIIIDLIE